MVIKDLERDGRKGVRTAERHRTSSTGEQAADIEGEMVKRRKRSQRSVSEKNKQSDSQHMTAGQSEGQLVRFGEKVEITKWSEGILLI